jgi:3-hydroxyacyl-CoA dehydrogenase/enoyl-CoA hydratase/3-hydroxybutyryl-CoA epimerase
MKNISVNIDSHGVWHATMDMPGRPFNVFSEDMMDDLESLIESVLADTAAGKSPKGLVIGSGKTSFLAGADLAMIQDFGAMRFSANWSQMRDRYSRLGRLFRRLEKLPIPVVAAINGLALGGGLELAMSCHARVCAVGRHVQLGLPEAVLGLLPGAGGTQRLPRYVGLEKGVQMLLSGAPVSPEQAYELGLVDSLSEPAALHEAATACVLELEACARWDRDDYQVSESDVAQLSNDFETWAASVSGVSAQDMALYPAYKAIVGCVAGGYGQDIDTAMDVEWDIFVDLMSHPISSNMVTTCFLEKTAASKHSLAKLPQTETPGSYAVGPGLSLGDSAFRKVPLRSIEDADIVLQSAGHPIAEAGLTIRDLLADQPLASELPELRYVGDLAKNQVLELASGADEKQTARAFALLQTSAKPVVLSSSGSTSVNEVLLQACRDTFAETGKTREAFELSASAVGLSGLVNMALDGARTSSTSYQYDPAYHEAGLSLLLDLSLAVYRLVVEQLSGDTDKDKVTLAGMDLLAVYGGDFPSWTGGPLSCLTMFQRLELKTEGAAEKLSPLAYTFKNELGYFPKAL